MDTILIRDARESDVSQIISVYYESWLATYPNSTIGVTDDDIEQFYKDAWSDSRINARKRHLREMPLEEVQKVAIVDDAVVGVGVLKHRSAYDQLQSLYILPRFMRQGIGTALFEALVSDSKNDLIVHVATYNTNAILFYEALGFRDTGKRFAEERHRMPVSGVCIPEMEMRRVYEAR